MAKNTALIFLLFDVASAWEVPFGVLLFIQCILHGLTSALHSSSLLTIKSVNFVVHTWWLLFVMEIVCNFHSGCFDCRGSFQTVVDLYCCITCWTYCSWHSSARQSIFSGGMRSHCFDVVCVRLTSNNNAVPLIIIIIIIIQNKLTNKCTKN